MNLAEYFSSKVPSLKAVASQHVNGELKDSSLKLLADVMQLLQRLVILFYSGIFIVKMLLVHSVCCLFYKFYICTCTVPIIGEYVNGYVI